VIEVDRPSRTAYALTLAEAAAARSEDPYRKVGTALMRADGSVASLGYNGAPPRVDIDWSDRDERRRWVIHAEANALRFVRPGEVSTAASTSLPCAKCMLLLASYGVWQVIYRDELDGTASEDYDRDHIMAIAARSHIDVWKEGS
jgi:dCMP deaminase